MNADEPIVVGEPKPHGKVRWATPGKVIVDSNRYVAPSQGHDPCAVFENPPNRPCDRPFAVERLEEMLADPPSVAENYPSYWGLVKQLAEIMRENERLRNAAIVPYRVHRQTLLDGERSTHECRQTRKPSLSARITPITAVSLTMK